MEQLVTTGTQNKSQYAHITAIAEVYVWLWYTLHYLNPVFDYQFSAGSPYLVTISHHKIPKPVKCGPGHFVPFCGRYYEDAFCLGPAAFKRLG